MSTDRIITERDGAIGRIVFNNPDKHNAMSLDMWRGAEAAVREMTDSGEVRVIVLTGAGEKAFVAGADISRFGEERKQAEAVKEYNAAVKGFQTTLIETPVPTIARIGGYCIGGGLGIALGCDIRLASDDSRFAIPAAKLGLGYAANGVDRLMQMVGPAFAKEIFYTARQFDAGEAAGMGLVNRVVPRDELDALVDDYTRRICENAPLTIKAAKLTIGELVKPEGERDLALSDRLVAECFASQDYAEGQTAFMEKRKPQFQGK